jgi:GTP-binding protein
LQLSLKPIVVINKIDRPEARPQEVIDEVLELFIELGADDEQLEFPIVYASARDGYAKLELNDESTNMEPLFETILKNVPSPKGSSDEPLQLLVSSIDYDDYVGRIAIGRVERGTIKVGQQAVTCKIDGSIVNTKISRLYLFEGLKRAEASEATYGDIVAVSGVGDITIGETICDVDCPEALPLLK